MCIILYLCIPYLCIPMSVQVSHLSRCSVILSQPIDGIPLCTRVIDCPLRMKKAELAVEQRIQLGLYHKI